jgi:hypothetical protein
MEGVLLVFDEKKGTRLRGRTTHVMMIDDASYNQRAVGYCDDCAYAKDEKTKPPCDTCGLTGSWDGWCPDGALRVLDEMVGTR